MVTARFTATLPDGESFRTLEMHTGGEPLRIVLDGFPPLRGATVLEQRADARSRYDHLRRALMAEPRGHADMYGAVPLAPLAGSDADFGVLFLHNEGWSTMCGHGIIALTTAWLDGAPDGDHEVHIDTPAGRVVARAQCAGGRAGCVTFENVPSFAVALDRQVSVQSVGDVRYDLAYGGAFYAYVDVRGLETELVPANAASLCALGAAILDGVAEAESLEHPSGGADLNFLYGVVLYDDRTKPRRNACVFAAGELDRSPTGTGVSGRAALLHARGELGVGESVAIASILDSVFEVRPIREVVVGDVPAIVPMVSGVAHAVGRGEFWLDPDDNLGRGFFLGRGR